MIYPTGRFVALTGFLSLLTKLHVEYRREVLKLLMSTALGMDDEEEKRQRQPKKEKTARLKFVSFFSMFIFTRRDETNWSSVF